MRDLAPLVREGLRLPAGLGLCVATYAADGPPGLSTNAWPSLARAVEARKREFLWGRHCARQALVAAGGEAHAPLPIRADRSPEWPEGWTGSISHASGMAAAIAGRVGDHPWPGLDVEALDALSYLDEIAPLVTTPGERALLDRPEDLLAVFSAKEALFKALGPGRVLEFDAAELVVIDGPTLTFRLTTDWSPCWRSGMMVPIRRFVLERWLFTVALPG